MGLKKDRYEKPEVSVVRFTDEIVFASNGNTSGPGAYCTGDCTYDEPPEACATECNSFSYCPSELCRYEYCYRNM